ncbi:MAG TPA: hypothetical protein VFO84_10705 [Dehalococcoidia bacterium]|nr:hypothetical protein [Dehalococcoidia bacterium]
MQRLRSIPGGTPNFLRGVAVWLLIVLGGVLLFVANAGLWVDREIYDSDNFVETTNQVFEDEDIQAAMADRLTARLVAAADISNRLDEELPERLRVLALPIASAAEDFIHDAVVRILESDGFARLRTRILEVFHENLIRVIEDDNNLLSTDSGTLTIDLRPVLQEVAADLGVDADSPLVARLDLPEDAGIIEVNQEAFAWSYAIAALFQELIIFVIVAAVICMALAVLIARNRRSALRNVGIAIAVVGILTLIGLAIGRYAIGEVAENADAARNLFDIVGQTWQNQSFALVVIGLLVLLGLFLTGESAMAASLRNAGRAAVRGDAAAPETREALRGYAPILRAIGLVTAALLLIVWPEPTTRFYITVVILAMLYLMMLSLLTSESPWAERTRAAVASWLEDGAASGTGRHVALVRVLAVGIAALLLVLLPSVSFGTVIVIVALTALVFVAVGWASSAVVQEPDQKGPA